MKVQIVICVVNISTARNKQQSQLISTAFMINQHNQPFGGNIYLNGMPQSGLFQKTCLMETLLLQ